MASGGPWQQQQDLSAPALPRSWEDSNSCTIPVCAHKATVLWVPEMRNDTLSKNQTGGEKGEWECSILQITVRQRFFSYGQVVWSQPPPGFLLPRYPSLMLQSRRSKLHAEFGTAQEGATLASHTGSITTRSCKGGQNPAAPSNSAGAS